MSNANQPGQQHESLLHTGEVIPAFTLPGADGMLYSPWNYKQREHLVLLFLRSTTTSETRGLLRTFAQHYSSFREETCAILAITPDTVFDNLHAQEALHLPFALLADPKGEVISRYTQWDNSARALIPSIVLADRYGALYQQWLAENEANLPPISELLDSLQYLNKLCTP